MDTKEAIEFIEGIKHSGNGYGNSYISDFGKLKDIISLLQQGEAYRQIVEDLEKDYGFLGHRYDGSDSTDYLRYVIPRLKQKYLKEKK